MQTSRLWRSLATYGTASALVMQLLGVFTPGQVKAAGPQLQISEINWAGSNGHPTDQWVELRNLSGSVINFAVTPYTLEADIAGVPTTIATLDGVDGILPADYYLVLTREQAGSAQSSLFGANANAFYNRDADLVLPTTATNYRLVQNGVVEDAIENTGAGLPFAGSAGTATQPIASMSRVSSLAPASDPASWYTTATTGVNFKLNSAVQYGTPGEDNIRIAAPTAVRINPAYSAPVGTNPTVSGKATAPATEVKVTYTRVSYNPFNYTRSYTGAVDGSGNFSVPATGPALEVGRYQVSVAAYTAAGHMSSVVNVPIAVDLNEYNYLVTPVSSLVPTPTLAAYPTLTNQGQVTFTGTLGAGSYDSVEITRNGEYYGTVPANGSEFTANVILLSNQVNTFAFYAVDTLGQFSMPAQATLTHDGTAPIKVDTTKVLVGINARGTNDTVVGQAGAAEANTTLYVYSDAALTQLLLSEVVAPDGSFAQFSIGDNQYGKVYLVLRDAAGNVSEAVVVTNTIEFSGSITDLKPSVSKVTENQVTVKWNAVPEAVSYRIKYKAVGGTYGQPMLLCPDVTNCSYTATIINLDPNTTYVVALAAVDRYGNESTYSEVSALTEVKQPEVVTVTEQTPTNNVPSYPNYRSNTGTGATDSVQNNTATASPSPSATPEEGEVKSATDDNSRNWTPWIILAIIIGIAILATAGYFYWFGGEVGEAATADAAAAESKRAEEKAAAQEQKVADKSSPGKKPNGGGKEKRW